MGVDLVWGAVGDVDAAAVSLPAGEPGGRKHLNSAGDTAVMFLFEFVLGSAWSGIAAEPKLLDEVVAFGIRQQRAERCSFGIGDDIRDVFLKPFGVGVDGGLRW